MTIVNRFSVFKQLDMRAIRWMQNTERTIAGIERLFDLSAPGVADFADLLEVKLLECELPIQTKRYLISLTEVTTSKPVDALLWVEYCQLATISATTIKKRMRCIDGGPLVIATALDLTRNQLPFIPEGRMIIAPMRKRDAINQHPRGATGIPSIRFVRQAHAHGDICRTDYGTVRKLMPCDIIISLWETE